MWSRFLPSNSYFSLSRSFCVYSLKLLNYISGVLYSLLLIWAYTRHHFIVWRNRLAFLGVQVCWWQILSFCLCKNVLISLFFWRISSLNIEFWVDYFPFSSLKMPFYCFVVSIVAEGKSSAYLYLCSSVSNLSFFFFVDERFLCLWYLADWLNKTRGTCTCVDLYVNLSSQGFTEIFLMFKLIILIKFGKKYQALILQILCNPFSS